MTELSTLLIFIILSNVVEHYVQVTWSNSCAHRWLNTEKNDQIKKKMAVSKNGITTVLKWFYLRDFLKYKTLSCRVLLKNLSFKTLTKMVPGNDHIQGITIPLGKHKIVEGQPTSTCNIRSDKREQKPGWGLTQYLIAGGGMETSLPLL